MYLIFGRPMSLFSEDRFQQPCNRSKSADEYVAKMTPRLKLIQDICAQNMVIYQNKYKQYYDKDINPARFVVGSKVLLHNPGAVRVGDTPKLTRMWVGPYIVTEIFDERNVRLFDPVKLKEMKPRVH